MTNPTCTIGDCNGKLHAKAMCQAHYRRQRKHGTIDAARPVITQIPEGHAWCPNCRTLKAVADFPNAADRARGVASYCRTCTTELRSTKYRPTLRIQQQRWMDNNPGKSAEYSRRYAEANQDKRSALRRRLVANNPDLYASIARAADANRRAREANAPGHATTEQVQARWDYFGGKCWMCGAEAVETDHVKPLAKGGSHWPANLRPACRDCNSNKRAKWPFPLEVHSNASCTLRGKSTPRTLEPVNVDSGIRG